LLDGTFKIKRQKSEQMMKTNHTAK